MYIYQNADFILHTYIYIYIIYANHRYLNSSCYVSRFIVIKILIVKKIAFDTTNFYPLQTTINAFKDTLKRKEQMAKWFFQRHLCSNEKRNLLQVFHEEGKLFRTMLFFFLELTTRFARAAKQLDQIAFDRRRRRKKSFLMYRKRYYFM